MKEVGLIRRCGRNLPCKEGRADERGESHQAMLRDSRERWVSSGAADENLPCKEGRADERGKSHQAMLCESGDAM